jgi:integrase
MSAFKRGKQGFLSIYVPLRDGWAQRSLGTDDTAFAREVVAMLRTMHRRWRAYDVLAAVADGRVTWDEVVALHDTGRAGLLALREALADVVLADHVEPWLAALLADGKSASTTDYYRRLLTQYTAAHPMRSSFNADTVRAFVRAYRGQSSTRRVVLYAIRSFARYLSERKLVDWRVLDPVQPPKKGAPRLHYRDAATDAAICRAADTPELRCYFALIHGSGAEVSATLAMRRRDVHDARLRIDVLGTKTPKRRRHDVALDAWALPFVLPHLAGKHPEAALFPGLTRRQVQEAHRVTRERLGIRDYTLRDARHSVAIRMRRDGDSFEAIAARLGNTVAVVHATYARFQPGDSPESTTTDRTTRRATAGGGRSTSTRVS